MKKQPTISADEQLTISKIPIHVEVLDKGFNGNVKVFSSHNSYHRKKSARYVRLIDAVRIGNDLPVVARVDNWTRSSVLYMTAEERSAYARALGVKVKLVDELARQLEAKEREEYRVDEVAMLKKSAAKLGFKLAPINARK